MTEKMEDFVVTLVPVSEWAWYLYRVEYKLLPDSPTTRTRYLVSTDAHIEHEVWAADAGAPFDCMYADWEIVKQVGRPQQVGVMYGLRISETARSAGEREAKALGLL